MEIRLKHHRPGEPDRKHDRGSGQQQDAATSEIARSISNLPIAPARRRKPA